MSFKNPNFTARWALVVERRNIKEKIDTCVSND